MVIYQTHTVVVSLWKTKWRNPSILDTSHSANHNQDRRLSWFWLADWLNHLVSETTPWETVPTPTPGPPSPSQKKFVNSLEWLCFENRKFHQIATSLQVWHVHTLPRSQPLEPATQSDKAPPHWAPQLESPSTSIDKGVEKSTTVLIVFKGTTLVLLMCMGSEMTQFTWAETQGDAHTSTSHQS